MRSDDRANRKPSDGLPAKRLWEPMSLTYLGHVGDVLQMPGGGKLSAVGGDPGDPRKPKGQG